MLRLGLVHLRVCPLRRAKLIAALLAFLAAGVMSSAAAARVKGKVFFVCLQAWGRGGRAALQELTVRQYSRYGGDALSDGLRCALEFLVAFLPVMPPCTMHLREVDRLEGYPLLVWTDAMYERVMVVPPGGSQSTYVTALDEVSGETGHGSFVDYGLPSLRARGWVYES
jgi:hypothetical protein